MYRCRNSAVEGLRRAGLERRLVHLGRLDDTVRQRELNLGGVELFDRGTLALLCLQLSGAEDLDGGGLSAAEARHVLVQRVDGIRQRDLAVLLVGIVRPCARVIPEPDAEVLDLLRGLFEDLVD